MSIAVVADSTCYLPAERIERHGITLVPLYVVFSPDRTVRETDITDYPAFFDELRGAEALPKTSQPSIGDFLDTYRPLLEQGRDVVSVHLSEALSGTASAARQAAEQLARETGEDRITVIDSRTAAGGFGLMVLAAVKAAETGGDRAACEAAVARTREDLKMWFAIDTLEFLRRGGRIGAAGAWIGSALKVKPILTVEEEMVPVERVRTSKRAFERMVDYARQRHASGLDGWAVQHISAHDEAERLADAGREIFGSDPLFVSEVGPVLSIHTGPGLIGVGSVPRELIPE